MELLRMKFSFIIPAYNNYPLLHQLLWDIHKNCSPVHEVIIVDDDSNDTTFLNGLSWWTSVGMLPIKHLRPINNLGFLRASNKGLKEAVGDVICLVSTDVRIFRDVVDYKYSPEFVVGGRYLGFDTGWNTFNGKIYPYLEGWMITAHKENWERVGYFDERYSPNDMEDVDISTKILEMGMGLQVYPDGYVAHIGAQTIGYTTEREKLTKINRRKFEEKWILKRDNP